MILETVCVGVMQVNCYVLAFDKARQAIIIDPGDEEAKIKKAGPSPAFFISYIIYQS